MWLLLTDVLDGENPDPEPEPDVCVTYPSSSCRLSPCAPEQCLLIAPVYPLFISRRQPIALSLLLADCTCLSYRSYPTTVSLSGLFISSTLPYYRISIWIIYYLIYSTVL